MHWKTGSLYQLGEKYRLVICEEHGRAVHFDYAILGEGAAKAEAIADAVMARVRSAVGLLPRP